VSVSRDRGFVTMDGKVDPIIKSLAKMRKARGLSQDEASFRAGISQDAVKRWELGYNSPTLSVLRCYMKVLGADLDVLHAPATLDS